MNKTKHAIIYENTYDIVIIMLRTIIIIAAANACPWYGPSEYNTKFHIISGITSMIE